MMKHCIIQNTCLPPIFIQLHCVFLGGGKCEKITLDILEHLLDSYLFSKHVKCDLVLSPILGAISTAVS